MSDIRIVQRPSGAEVDVLSDRVVKRQDPLAARCERERTEWGERIGRESGLFRVPRILSCDESRGEIVFERLGRMRMFGEAVREGASAERLMTLQGRALAAIHIAMPAPDPADDAVSLHGDFSYVNLFHAADTEDLWVIDWCNAYWFGLPANQRFASSSLDLAAFLISLFCHRFLVTRAIPGVERLAESFFASYAADRGDRFELARLRSDLPEIARRWQQARARQAGWARAALHGPGLHELRRFITSTSVVR